MARRGPSYADLVHKVLQAAGEPLTIDQIIARVGAHRPVNTRDPKATIRRVIYDSYQLVSLGDGRYGHLSHLIRGSILRLPLVGKKPANHPLVYTEEADLALFPGRIDVNKRRDERPAQVCLPNGEDVALRQGFLDEIHGAGCPMPDAMRRYLIQNRAAEGDALLIRVVDAHERRYEAWFEARRKRDEAAVARRNAELLDATHAILMRGHPVHITHELARVLLAQGFFLGQVAPDRLEPLLEADERFVDMGWGTWVAAERVTPEMEARMRLSRSLAADDILRYLLGEEDTDGIPEMPSPHAMRATMERSMADLAALLSEEEFDSSEEMQAFLADVIERGDVPRRKARTRLEQAQELAYDAWEAESPRERIRLAKKALALSPDCADAYVILAEETARTPKEAANLYARGVAAGERALGEEGFEEYAGTFWGVLTTRPYMRARLGLALALWEMGKHGDAIAHAWDMLRLNPSDNQGVRYILLDWLLESGDDRQAGELLNRCPGDAAAEWMYGRALHAFRVHGDAAESRRFLAEAVKWNPYVPDYLLGRKRLPRVLPDLIGIGDESEAVSCAAAQMAAWYKTRGALAWLEQNDQ